MKKTPAMKCVFSPGELIQKKLRLSNIQNQNEYRKKIKEAKKNKEDVRTIVKPVDKTLYLSDTTIEALIDVLGYNPLGVIIKKDELNQLFNSLNAYKNGGGDLETILELYGQEDVTLARKGRDFMLQTNTPYLNIVGGIQLKPLKDFLSNKENGIKERFIFAVPDMNFKSEYSHHEINKKNKEIYNKKVQEIFYESLKWIEADKEFSCSLSDEAKELWVEWQKTFPDDNEHGAMFEKAIARALKIALILHVLKNPDRKNKVVNEQTMHNALLMSNYFVNSYLKLFYIFENKETEDLANHAKNWLIRCFKSNSKLIKISRGNAGVTARDFQRHNKSKYKNSDEATTVFEELERRGIGYFPHLSEEQKKNNPVIFVLHKNQYE